MRARTESSETACRLRNALRAARRASLMRCTPTYAVASRAQSCVAFESSSPGRPTSPARKVTTSERPRRTRSSPYRTTISSRAAPRASRNAISNQTSARSKRPSSDATMALSASADGFNASAWLGRDASAARTSSTRPESKARKPCSSSDDAGSVGSPLSFPCARTACPEATQMAGNSGEAHAMTALPAICVASGQAVLAQGNDSGDPTLLASSLELHGFRAFDSGRVDDVRAALASLPNHALALNPSALALKAMVASLDGRFDLADVWFEMALRDARGAAREEIVVRYGLDLVRRGRSDVVTFLAGEVGRPGLDDSNATQLCALLATAYVGVHRMSDARRAARKALRSLHAVSDDSVRARIFHQAAFVALNDGDMTSAGDLARFALEHAERAELYDVAARALSVLHNLRSASRTTRPQRARISFG